MSPARPAEPPPEPAVPTWTVLHEEFAQIHGSRVPPLDRTHLAAVLAELAPDVAGDDAAKQAHRRTCTVNEARYRHSVHQLDGAGQTALCLSGGGIRSAAFCLGVLQGLARRGLLHQFHYLSTVSGGGYIGSWLTAWIHRAGQQGDSLATVEERLAHPAGLTAAVAAPLKELRGKQQYITPRAGLLSADTWAAIGLLQRDLLLNWLVFIPLITAVLLVPRALEWGLMWWGYVARDPALGGTYGGSLFGAAFTRTYAAFCRQDCGTVPPWPGLSGAVDLVGSLLVLLGVTVAIRNRIGTRTTQFNDRRYIRTVMLPVVGGILLLVIFLAPLAIGAGPPDTFLLAEWIVGTVLTFLGARLFAAAAEGPRGVQRRAWDRDAWMNLGLECLALAGAGATSGLLIWCVLWLRAAMQLNTMMGLRDLAAFGVPVMLLAYLLGQSIYAGLTSHSRFSPGDREWLARSSGYYLLWALAWAVCASLVLFGPRLIDFGHAVLVAGGTGALTLGTAVSRFAKATTALSATKERFPITKLTEAACLIFVAAGAVVLSHLTVLVLDWLDCGNLESGPAVANAMQAAGFRVFAIQAAVQAQAQAGQGFAWAVGLCLACAAISLAVSFFVNVNTFSLHALYEARLVRTFLGASNVASVTGKAAVRNAFTDFCDADDLNLSDMRRPPRSPLFPVLGMALNLVRANNLAWQERKACSFVATPLHVGSDQVDYRRPTDEMTLGSAMAISGAAASPNWGYHSSPLVGFVMMLFNIRLGQWLPNPAYKTVYGTKMRSFLLMLQEATGRTTDTQPNIYVSDGGHFDNLGVYEMLRRRCRTILVVDASQDAKMTLEDLGSTLRKAAIDLGVTVEFGPLGMARRADPLAPGLYAGVGRILYPEGRSARLGRFRCRGTLIYIKPGAYADVPADVRAYAASNAAFPHDSTGNQFFTESQFESYRTLGSHVVGRVFGKDSSTVPIERLPGLAARYIRSVMGHNRR